MILEKNEKLQCDNIQFDLYSYAVTLINNFIFEEYLLKLKCQNPNTNDI